MSSSSKFEGPIEGYVVNFLVANYWRVESSMQRADVMQEAYIIYMRIAQRYPKVEPKHFMALFKRAWSNHFTDLAYEDSRLRALAGLSRKAPRPEGDKSPEIEAVGDLENEGRLALLIEQAPREVRMVLNLFLNAPQEILDVALRGWNGRNKRERTGGSKHVCKLLGLPEDLDVMKQVEEHFRL